MIWYWDNYDCDFCFTADGLTSAKCHQILNFYDNDFGVNYFHLFSSKESDFVFNGCHHMHNQLIFLFSILKQKNKPYKFKWQILYFFKIT